MSQVRRDAAAWSASSAWNVNFNNGNVNNNHRNNNGFALAVRRAGEFQGGVTLQGLHRAWKRARRQKVPSHNQRRFDTRWMDNLIQLQEEIASGTWSPRPSTCFIATRPKAREIHAPDFADRVVHHWLVPQLEAIYEPGFIHDSYANRAGKGSHAAVRRAQAFCRQLASGQGGGWYLQLDIANYFNSIHRPTLWAMLKPRLLRAGLHPHALQTTHALLRRDPLHPGAQTRATAAELAQVPAHKRLCNAGPGCGLPIGNLSSQFFANVYLDALDQLAKHQLKAKRYLRYVDDFVLFHRDRAQLEAWQAQITDFLGRQLHLGLKAEIRLRRLDDGLDFLGYVIRPTHTLVRPRVVAHAKAALQKIEAALPRDGQPHFAPEALQRVQAVLASYGGHFRHANARRLTQHLTRRFPWAAMSSVHASPPAGGVTSCASESVSAPSPSAARSASRRCWWPTSWRGCTAIACRPSTNCKGLTR
ncbi:RNA-directed DNA polymerase [Pseudoxanthomonas winnipegensis]|uniref:RNA-directed DNA polymerase n=1 Tax=Pseudoxanthomonas winnipegensis TaxID=2480810 RepID=UPI001D1914CF|nr:RNA-directed DNA polymerase [Pseudoxanthomonas winnipegensis]